MRYLTLDFETVDPYLSLKLGPGWPYLLNLGDKSLMKIVGFSWVTSSDSVADGFTGLASEAQYLAYQGNEALLKRAVETSQALIMHNACYDAGILMALGIDIKSKVIYDTKIMSKLIDNTKPHSLNDLGKRYLKEPKSENALIQAVIKYDLYPYTKLQLAKKARFEKMNPTLKYPRVLPENKVLKWAKEHMDQIPIEFMSIYGAKDSDLTFRCWEKMLPLVDPVLSDKYSKLTHICLEMRAKGVRLDLDQARKIHQRFIPLLAEAANQIFLVAGKEFNFNSPSQTAEVCSKLGLKCPKTENGALSVTTPWLLTQDHPIAKAIVTARKLAKLDGDFIQKMVEIQGYTLGVPPEVVDSLKFGRIYPEPKLLGADTGRFSYSAPNIQQIPARDEFYAPWCRSIFVPEEGEDWYTFDFNNQEGRFQVHYSELLNCTGASELVSEFNKNPKLDMHQKVADLVGIKRKEAKTINLGLSYGMGVSKLSLSLGQSLDECKRIVARYNKKSPYLKELMDKCSSVIKKRGYVKTIWGRKLFADRPMPYKGRLITYEYKAINKIMQGSAADQTKEAMLKCYEKGLLPLFPVHDELNFSLKCDTIAKEIKEIMETCIQLKVPSVTDYGTGKSWGEAKFGTINLTLTPLKTNTADIEEFINATSN